MRGPQKKEGKKSREGQGRDRGKEKGWEGDETKRSNWRKGTTSH